MKTGISHLLLASVAVYIVVIETGFFEKNLFNAFGIFLISLAILWLTAYMYDRKYFRKLPKLVEFLIYFMKEWVKSILKVAQEIMTKKIYMNPAVIAVPLLDLSDFELTCIVNTIILTPSTLSVDISEDRRTLYVHTFFVPEGGKPAFIKDFEDGLENKLLAVTR